MRAVCFLVLCGAVCRGAVSDRVVSHSAVSGAVRLPVVFEPNRGQNPAHADFLARVPGYVVSLGSARTEWIAPNTRVVTVLSGARTGVRGEGEQAQTGVVNYWRGPDTSRWILDVPTFGRVRYRGVYAGIDLVYYAHDGRLEYDFDVAPGADPGQIRMRFEGSAPVHLDRAGDLVIDTAAGRLHQHLPAIYQQVDGVRRTVAGRFVLRGRTARLELARYDRTRPLVIDPALTWATYVGGSGADSSEGVALDSSGNIYIAGTTLSSYGDYDVFFAKLNPTGTAAIYTTVYGGSNNDYGHAIAVDSGGNVYIAGETVSSDFPELPYTGSYPYLNYYPGYSDDAFVTKADSSGKNAVFSHYYGGSGSDGGFGLALDSANNVYMVGSTNSSGLLVSAGSAQPKYGGGMDAFVVAFSATGSGVYATYLGGSGDDYGNSIAVDSSGNAYVAGSTASTNFPVTGSAYQAKSAGGSDVFVSKLAPSTGALVFSTYLGGGASDIGNAIAIDSSGAVYVTGETTSADFPVLGAYQKVFGGGAGDAFLTKLSGDGGSLIYSTYIGGSGEDYAYGLAVDAGGNAYVTGGTASMDYPVSDPFQAANQGTTNALVTGINAAGSGLLFSSYLGGNGSAATGGTDFGNSVAVSCSAGLVVTGNTSSSNFPVTTGAFTTTYAGGASDAFVAKIAAGGGTPAISTGGVVNGATFSAAPMAPGSLISIFGSSLALASQQTSSTPWPTTLAGATVSVNGTPVPVYYASAGQVNVQLPYEIGIGTAVVTASGQCGMSVPLTFQVARAAPFLFQSGTGDAIVQNQDYSVNGPANPAKPGSVITVYLTGIGPLDNPVPTGAAAPLTTLSRATLPSSATIGGWDAPVAFLGLTPSFVGLAQANLTVPALGAGGYPVVITVGGVASNAPNVYVKP